MYFVEVDYPFEVIEEALREVCPNVRIEHVVTDDALKNLGFVDHAPCRFTIDLNEEGFDEMMDDLLQLEVDAFNTPNGEMPSEDDELYQRYIKYGWLYDMFDNTDVFAMVDDDYYEDFSRLKEGVEMECLSCHEGYYRPLNGAEPSKATYFKCDRCGETVHFEPVVDFDWRKIK